jgi:hypothetical protein
MLTRMDDIEEIPVSEMGEKFELIKHIPREKDLDVSTRHHE